MNDGNTWPEILRGIVNSDDAGVGDYHAAERAV